MSFVPKEAVDILRALQGTVYRIQFYERSKPATEYFSCPYVAAARSRDLYPLVYRNGRKSEPVDESVNGGPFVNCPRGFSLMRFGPGVAN